MPLYLLGDNSLNESQESRFTRRTVDGDDWVAKQSPSPLCERGTKHVAGGDRCR